MKMTGIKILLVVLCPLVILGCGDKPDSPQDAPPDVTTPKDVSTPPETVEIKPDLPQEVPQEVSTPPETMEIKLGSPQDTSQKVNTPQGILENMRSALLGGDKQAFVDCFDAQGKQEEMIGAFYEFSVVASQYDKAMRKAYGDEAVNQATGGRSQSAPFQDEDWLKDITLQIDGDTATAVMDGQPEGLRLVKRDGLWKISADSMLGDTGATDENIDQLIQMFQIMGGVITEVSQKIGQTDYTAEKINQELSQAMMMAMMQAAGAPEAPSQ
jgi:hypothetical protein